MSKDHLRTGDKAVVKFRFIKQPEYLRPETRLVFREGRTKAVGTILSTDPNAHPPPTNLGKTKHRGPSRNLAAKEKAGKDGSGSHHKAGKEGPSTHKSKESSSSHAHSQTSSERTGKK